MCDINQRILFEALSICGGSFEKLKQLMDDPKLSKRTVFDFDFSDPNDRMLKFHQLLAFNSLSLGPGAEEMEFIEHHPVLAVLPGRKEREIAVRFMQRVFRILEINNLGLDWHSPLKPGYHSDSETSNRMDVGSAVLLFGSLFNHSCIHNVDRIVVDNKTVFYAKCFIPKGQQLFTNYG